MKAASIKPFLLLLPLLSRTALSAAPPPITFNDIQPDNGGSEADNCGDNKPVVFGETSWKDNNVDNVISSVWALGRNNPTFDFHQQFSRNYGISLYCPNIFSTCTGDPSSCSQLTGSVLQKKQGWLGIKALLTLQDLFLQYEKSVNGAIDGLTVDLTFIPPVLPDKNEDFNRNSNIVVTVVQGVIAIATVAGAVTATTTLSTALIGGLGALISGFVSVAGNSINDHHADEAIGPTDFSILDLSDARRLIKNAMLTALDLAHNATFSNGMAGPYKGAEIPSVLRGGAFSGSTIPQAYARDAESLDALIQRVLTAKLFEAAWRIQDSFIFRVKTVTDPNDCARWYTTDNQRTDVKLCDGDRGLFVLRSVVRDGNNIKLTTPLGSTSDQVKAVGQYNIALLDLVKSAADNYVDNGLDGIDFLTGFPNILKSWQNNGGIGTLALPGVFSLPICESTNDEWRDMNEGSTQAPCSCKKSMDKNNKNFLDYASDLVKEWVNDRTGC